MSWRQGLATLVVLSGSFAAAGGTPTAEAAAVDGHDPSEIRQAWQAGGADLASRVARTRQRALAFGVGDVEGAARAMLDPRAPGPALSRAMLAVRLAPGLPLAHMALARALWDEGEHRHASAELALALRAIPGHLEASLWLGAALLVLFVGVLLIAPALFIAAIASDVFRSAAHDLGDFVSRSIPGFARAALMAALLLVPLALGEALLGLLLGLFALAFAYGETRSRVALVLAAALIVLALHPVAQWAGASLDALDSDPVASAAMSVMRGVETPTELSLLSRSAAEDDLAEHALAQHARRSGAAGEAENRYNRLLAAHPNDPVALANLANLHFQRGEIQIATGLYERAAQKLSSATLYFDLSQAYARSFRMEEFEMAMQQAQRLEPELVAELSRKGDPDLVADLQLPMARMRYRMLASADGAWFAAALRAAVAPGLTGNSSGATALGFLGAAMLGLAAGRRSQPSSRCVHCGRRVCARCDGSIWNSETCESCHRLFNQPETTDASLRRARLMDLRARELRQNRSATLASLLVPGAAGIIAKRPDLALLGLLSFSWAVATIGWRGGVVVDPLALGDAGPVVLVGVGVVSLAVYAAVIGASLLARRRR